MSSVSSTPDGGYRYYQKQISDLEDDLRAEAKRARENQAEDLANLEKAHDSELANREEETNRTVASVRENANRQIEKERKKANEEVARLKAQNYDRLGRVNGEELNGVRQQLNTADQQMRDLQRKEREARDMAEENYQQRIQDTHYKAVNQAEKQIDAAKEETRKAYETLERERRMGADESVGRSKSGYESLRDQALAERNEARRRYESALDEITADYKHRLKASEEKGVGRSQEREADQQVRMEKAIAEQKKLHAEETQELRDKVRTIQDDEVQRAKNGAQSAARLIGDYEDDFRTRIRQMDERYDTETSKLHRDLSEVEGYEGRKKQEAMQKQEQLFTSVISRQNQENADQVKDLRDTYDRDHMQLTEMNRRAVASAEKRHEQQAEKMAVETQRLLENQAGHFIQNERNNARSNQETIDALKNQVKEARGYTDPNSISPQAEEAVRNSAARDFEKVMKENDERSDRRVDSIRDEYKNRMRELQSDSETSKLKLKNDARLEIDSDRNRYSQFIEDSQFQKEKAIRDKEAAHERSSQKVFKNNAYTLDEQRRQYEDIMETMRFDHQRRLNAVKSEADFQMKQAQREHALAATEQARAAEKNLADLKEQYEAQLANEKYELRKINREQEKQFQAHNEEQNRVFEQRLKQQELQHKERERTVAENYQNELDKLRRANAAIIQKKG